MTYTHPYDAVVSALREASNAAGSTPLSELPHVVEDYKRWEAIDMCIDKALSMALAQIALDKRRLEDSND